MEDLAYIRLCSLTEDRLKVEYENGNVSIAIGKHAGVVLPTEYILAYKENARRLCDFIQQILQDKGA